MRRKDVKRKDVKQETDVSRDRFTFYVLRFRRAFTLLEMLVTLALIAILAAAVTVSLAGPRRAAAARDVAEEVLHYDRSAREWSRRFGQPGRLVFDLSHATVRRHIANSTSDASQPSVLRLAGDVRIARVMTAGKQYDAGEVSLPCSSRGQTPSYALLLNAPGGQRQWLFVAGMTGRATAVNNDRELEAIFRALSAGDDAP